MSSQNKTFTANSVHTHYSCGCNKKAKVRMEPNDKMKIDVILSCDKCSDGRALHLVIGRTAIEVSRCPHPGCNCNQVSMCPTKQQFLSFLSA